MPQKILINSSNLVSNEELTTAIHQILNIDKQKVLDNLELFLNINIYVRNIFYYLSKMKGDQMLIDASHSMEFIINFHKINHDKKRLPIEEFGQ